MPSAEEIFAGGSDQQKRYLETAWNALFVALQRDVAQTPGVRKFRPCELGLPNHPEATSTLDLPDSVGRILADGPAACARCLARIDPSRPNGYPLDRHGRTS